MKALGLTQRRKDAKGFFLVQIKILCALAALREQ
jgi:hypothetical protein